MRRRAFYDGHAMSAMARQRGAARLGILAGAVTPPLLATVFVALTIAQRAFLERLGWSPVRETAVAWPSVLAIGPYGWVEQIAFVVAAALGLVFALALVHLVPRAAAKVGAAFLGFAALAIAFMALPPDPPGVAARSWQDAVHDGVYPTIPSASLAAAVALAIGLWQAPGWRQAARGSAVVFTVALIAFGLGSVDAIGQLVRYVLFASLLVWLEVLTVVAWRRTSPPARAESGPATTAGTVRRLSQAYCRRNPPRASRSGDSRGSTS